MAVIQLTSENFEQFIKNDKVIVDFYADWCGPCKMQGPIVEKIADNNADINVGKLNVDDEMDISEQFSIVSIPTLLIFKGGNLVQKFVGLTDEAEILAALE